MKAYRRTRVLRRKIKPVFMRKFQEDEWEDLSAGGGDDQDKGK